MSEDAPNSDTGCFVAVFGVAVGFIVGRFGFGPLVCPAGSKVGGVEQVEWTAWGFAFALAFAAFGATVTRMFQQAVMRNRGRD